MQAQHQPKQEQRCVMKTVVSTSTLQGSRWRSIGGFPGHAGRQLRRRGPAAVHQGAGYMQTWRKTCRACVARLPQPSARLRDLRNHGGQQEVLPCRHPLSFCVADELHSQSARTSTAPELPTVNTQHSIANVCSAWSENRQACRLWLAAWQPANDLNIDSPVRTQSQNRRDALCLHPYHMLPAATWPSAPCNLSTRHLSCAHAPHTLQPYRS